MGAENVLTTRRKFAYAVHPDVIRHFVENLGYATSDVGSREEVIGFDVVGTTVRVDFDIVVNDQIVAKGMVSVTNTPLTTGGDLEKARRSVQLYKRLYNRFRERTT